MSYFLSNNPKFWIWKQKYAKNQQIWLGSIQSSILIKDFEDNQVKNTDRRPKSVMVSLLNSIYTKSNIFDSYLVYFKGYSNCRN
jgi:hypothetical protein